MRIIVYLFSLLSFGCGDLKKVESTPQRVVLQNKSDIAGGFSRTLAWDWTPNYQDVWHETAFNVFESPDLQTWNLIGTTTGLVFQVQSYNPQDFYRVGSFYTR